MPKMYFPPRGSPVVNPSVCDPKSTKFERNYYKALKAAVTRKKVKILDKNGDLINQEFPMWKRGKHTCEVYNGPCMVCLVEAARQVSKE
jgi:hypothetical protein